MNCHSSLSLLLSKTNYKLVVCCNANINYYYTRVPSSFFLFFFGFVISSNQIHLCLFVFISSGRMMCLTDLVPDEARRLRRGLPRWWLGPASALLEKGVSQALPAYNQTLELYSKT